MGCTGIEDMIKWLLQADSDWMQITVLRNIGGSFLSLANLSIDS